MSVDPGRCCIPGCNTKVNKEHLVCVPHWCKIPDDMRREVYKRQRGWQDGRGFARKYLADNFPSLVNAGGAE